MQPLFRHQPPRLPVVRSILTAACAAAMSGQCAHAQTLLPGDFEPGHPMLSKLYSYFGGVGSYSIEQSTQTCYFGQSAHALINFQHDAFFRSAGVGFGNYALTGGMLSRAADASLFSITIDASGVPAGKQLALIVTIQEDDNGDGVIDTLGDDDSWKSVPVTLLPGVHVYNIGYGAFADVDPDVGNGVRNFNTAGVLGLVDEFQSKAAFPGGMIETPVNLYLDHLGLFANPQTIPAACPADVDGTGGVTVDDLFMFLEDWFAYFGLPAAPAGAIGDFDQSGAVGVADLFDYLDAWFMPCP